MDYDFCRVIFEEELYQLEARWENEQAAVRSAALLMDSAEHTVQYLTSYSLRCEEEGMAWVRQMIRKSVSRKP